MSGDEHDSGKDDDAVPAALRAFLNDGLPSSAIVSAPAIAAGVSTSAPGTRSICIQHLPLSLDDLPIPEVVTIGDGWSGQMTDLAAQIGPRAVLLICEAFGGQRVPIPSDWERSPFLHLIGEEAARMVMWLYGTHRFDVPVAKVAIERAKRGPILAAVRAKAITHGRAAAILRCRRTHIYHLLNELGEGLDAEPIDFAAAQRWRLRRIADDLLAQLALAGAPADAVAGVWTAIAGAAATARDYSIALVCSDDAPDVC